MTPKDYAILAQQAYIDSPTFGIEQSSARAVVQGNIVAFPGTNNIECWLTDLDAVVTSVTGLGNLHAGFWKAFLEILDPAMALSPSVLVGHSEGAALAILYGAMLCLAGKPPREIYGFEPPRVSADVTLKHLFQDHGVKVYLYRNGEDLVPLVPDVIYSWQHPAELIKIGKPFIPFPNVQDHMIDRVIEALS